MSLLAACSSRTSSPPQDAAAGLVKPYTLTLLHINDHHSHLDESRLALLMDSGTGRREPVQLPVGGFARVATAMQELAAQAKGPVIKIHAGDAITGDLYFSLTQGYADADLMNVVCFDSFTLGNHEFDHGDAALKRFIDRLQSHPSCNTAVLSANVSFAPDSALHPSHAAGTVQPSVVLERNGRRIGLVGITVAGKTQNASRPDAGTRFSDEATAAQAEINRLKRQGVDIIVLQTHYGYQADVALAQKLHGVNAIVGGDSHTLLGPKNMAKYGLSPRGPYPTQVKNADGDLVCVAQAGHYGYVVGELKLNFDAADRLKSCQGTPHVLVGNEFQPAKSGEAQAQLNHEAIHAGLTASGFFRLTQNDPHATNVLEPYRKKKLEFGSSVVVHAKETLCARRMPGTQAHQSGRGAGVCQERAHLESHGGDIQQLVAIAFLQQARSYFDADLALINAGGVRTDLPAGPVTVKDIHTLLPFKNTLVQLQVSGATLKRALEGAVAAALSDRPSTGAYPYAAGMRWTLNAQRPDGEKLINLEVLDANGRYQALEPQRIYTVATIDFIAEGKDHYQAFQSLTKDQVMDVGLDATGLFLQYASQLHEAGNGLRLAPTPSYSTQAYIPAR